MIVGPFPVYIETQRISSLRPEIRRYFEQVTEWEFQEKDGRVYLCPKGMKIPDMKSIVIKEEFPKLG